MEERAQVIRLVNKDIAEVELRGHSACSACGKCSHGAGKDIRYDVINPINARVGDMVVLEMETKKLLSAVFVIYLLPLLTLILGFGIGSWINSILKVTSGEGFAVVVGLVFMALTFVFVRLFDRRAGQNSGFRPKIKRIIYE